MCFVVVVNRAYSKTRSDSRCETLYVGDYDRLIELLNSDLLGDCDVNSVHIFIRDDS